MSSEQAGVLRSSALMAAGTVTSRATGLIRDMALVAAIGFGTLADTYSLGNSLPSTRYSSRNSSGTCRTTRTAATASPTACCGW